jgi:hypothetical protein
MARQPLGVQHFVPLGDSDLGVPCRSDVRRESAVNMARAAQKLRAIAALTVLLAMTACGGGSQAPASKVQQKANESPSPCQGVDSWKSAGAAGRHCAALVRRWVPVRSIRLTTRLPDRVRSTCEQARRQARIAVVCPPLVPAGGVVDDPGLYGAEFSAPARNFYLLTFNNGENPGRVHWIVGAGRRETVQRNLFNPRIWDVPGRIRRLGEHRYGPWTMAFYRFPPHPSGGPLGGHDLALIRLDGTTYLASIHGWKHHDADAAMLIAILLIAGAPQ